MLTKCEGKGILMDILLTHCNGVVQQVEKQAYSALCTELES